MTGVTPRSAKFLNAVHLDCYDHCEFDQVAYIKEALHDRFRTKSPHAEGVCDALCAYVLTDWIQNKGSRKRMVDQFVMDCNDRNSNRPTIEVVMSYIEHFAQPKKWHDNFTALLAQTTKHKPIKTNMEVKTDAAVKYTLTQGCGLIALGATVADDGHATLCDGKNLTFFDPNVGYYQAPDKKKYAEIYQKMFDLHGGKSQAVTMLFYT